MELVAHFRKVYLRDTRHSRENLSHTAPVLLLDPVYDACVEMSEALLKEGHICIQSEEAENEKRPNFSGVPLIFSFALICYYSVHQKTPFSFKLNQH